MATANNFWGGKPSLSIKLPSSSPAPSPRPWDLPSADFHLAAESECEGRQQEAAASLRSPLSPQGLALLLEGSRSPTERELVEQTRRAQQGGVLVLPMNLRPSASFGPRASELQAALTPSPPPSVRLRLGHSSQPPPHGRSTSPGAAAGLPPAASGLHRTPSGFFSSHLLAPSGGPGELPLPIDQRGPTPREQVSEAKRLADIEEGAVRRGALHLLRAVGGGGGPGRITHLLAGVGAGSEAAAVIAALQAALQVLRPADIDTAAEYEAWLRDRVAGAVADRRRAERLGLGGAGARTATGAGAGSPSQPMPSNRSSSGHSAFTAGGLEGLGWGEGSSSSSLPAGSLLAAGGGEEAAALAAMDLQATMDTFLSRFVFGVQRGVLGMSGGQPPPALRSMAQESPPKEGGAAAPAPLPSSSAEWGSNPTVLPKFITESELQAWIERMHSAISADSVSEGGVYAQAIAAELEMRESSNGGERASSLLLGQLLLRLLVIVHSRGCLAPLAPAAAAPGSGSSSPASTGRSSSSSSSGGGAASPAAKRKDIYASPIVQRPPRLTPPALCHPLAQLLVQRMGIPPRSAALLQCALALRGRLDDMRLALSSRSPSAMAELRLPAEVAASLGAAELAGNAGEVAQAQGEMLRVMARRASMTELQRNTAIALGIARGYTRYARGVPGQQLSVPRVQELEGDTEGEAMSDAQLQVMLGAVEASVARREALFAQEVEGAWERLRKAPDVDALKAAAKESLEDYKELQRKRAEGRE